MGGPAGQMPDLRAPGPGSVLGSSLLVNSALPSLQEGSRCFSPWDGAEVTWVVIQQSSPRWRAWVGSASAQ